jgi:murein DD-endopeptidase MepM/ murein hydrolase activator NlpD
MLMPIMGDMRRFRLALPVLLITLLGVIPVTASAQTEDIEDAKEAKENAYDEWLAARAEVDSAVAVLVDLEGQLADLEYRIDRMEGRIDEDEDNIADLRSSAQNLVINAYINSGSSTLESALGASNIQDILTAQHIINRAADRGTATLDRLDAITRDLQRQSSILDEDRLEIDTLRAQQADIVANLDELEAIAEELYREAKAEYAAEVRAWEEAERQRKIAEAAKRSGAAGGLPAGTIPDFICPVSGTVSFRNDWGNPRSGGRTHKGTDMFAKKGTPVVAVTDGTLRFRDGGLGGIAIWLKGGGASYYYAHLDSRASGLSTGSYVNRGTVIGYVGNTGNAYGGADHLHFQLHPGHGSPVNPYPTLAASC